jgi:hypothetical protein
MQARTVSMLLMLKAQRLRGCLALLSSDSTAAGCEADCVSY